ncbi:MAG: type II pantothenate kinase [Bacillus sp. (in: firmicutes)]
MSKTIGIDAGGSLIKLVYKERGSLHYKKYPVSELEAVINWLNIMQVDKVGLTGGMADYIKEKFFPQANIIHEFHAVCDGANWLLKEKNIAIPEKYLLVHIGTGTSWYMVEKEKRTRILGSGIGGGTWMGLGSILTNETNFAHLVNLAASGNRTNIDLLVKDIYLGQDSQLNGELTASNFAKTKEGNSEKDMAASLLQMIGETIFLLTQQAALSIKPTFIVYSGSTIAQNKPLQAILSSFEEQVDAKQLFLEHGEYGAAISAYLSLEQQ